MTVLNDVKDAFTLTSGDWGCLTQLAFDNLSTLLGVIFAIQDMQNFGVDRAEIDELVWGRIVPGVGITLLIGNVYYAWQAARLTNKYGRQYTAQVSVTAQDGVLCIIHQRPFDVVVDVFVFRNRTPSPLAWPLFTASHMHSCLFSLFLVLPLSRSSSLSV